LKSDSDIIVISTPVDTHHSLGKEIGSKQANTFGLKNHLHQLQQKLTNLIELADKKNLKIFVDHTFIYNGAVRKIKELIDNKELGNIIYFDSERINLGLFQKDVM